MNLIKEAWLPVRTLSGQLKTIAPYQITENFADDPIMELAFDRPDFNGAVTEFLIGLFAVVNPIKPEDWVEQWQTPPSSDKLQGKLAKLAPYFNLFGDENGNGPRCFQDFDPLDDAKESPISQLLIDAPGDNTTKLNVDLFNKRKGDDHYLTWSNAAAALITMQTYAPSGGAGFRTSMRGGGPLTTLNMVTRDGYDRKITTLWDIVIANQGKAQKSTLDETLFPWLAPCTISKGKDVVLPQDRQDLFAFFACPRRIRLVRDGSKVTGLRQVNYGENYALWLHPLSPYYVSKTELLPIHPRNSVPTFRDWPNIWQSNAKKEEGKVATCIRYFETVKNVADGEFGITLENSIWAFGFDMDNAKARRWSSINAPYISQNQSVVFNFMDDIMNATNEAATALKFAIRNLRHGKVAETETGKQEIKLSPVLSNKAAAEIVPEFELWLEYRLRQVLVRAIKGERLNSLKIEWRDFLRKEALKRYEEEALSAANQTEDFLIIPLAQKYLRMAFGEKGKTTKALKIKT